MERKKELSVLDTIRRTCLGREDCADCQFYTNSEIIADRCIFYRVSMCMPERWNVWDPVKGPFTGFTPEQAFAEHTRLARLYVDFPDYIQGDYEPVQEIKEDILKKIDKLREIEKSALGQPSQ